MSVLSVPQPAATKLPEHNRIGLDYHRPVPRPKVRGVVIDYHTHMVAARHAATFFAAASHYGIDVIGSMTPLEEAVAVQRDWPGRVQFIAIPQWRSSSVDDWRNRIEAFYNLGSRVVKFHMAPGSMEARGWRLDSPKLRPVFEEIAARRMAIMTHVGDPDTWYGGKYADAAKYGTRDEHYRMWETMLSEYPNTPWMAAHMGGNPENLPRLQSLLDRYPKLMMDSSATKWMLREISARREQAREFFIRNQDRIVWGSDQVTGDQRDFDFLASRFWALRKLIETAYIGPSPIFDPDLPEDNQPLIRGLALPDGVLQKLYHDNAMRFFTSVGADVTAWREAGVDSPA
jgi:hypothetical protein